MQDLVSRKTAHVQAEQRENQQPGGVRTDEEDDADCGPHNLNKAVGARDDPFWQRRVIATDQQPAAGPPRHDTGKGDRHEGHERPHVYRS